MSKERKSYLTPLILGLASLTTLLHVWASYFPDANNWGFHMFAFLSFEARILFTMAMLICLLPPVQRRIVRFVDGAMESVRTSERWTKLALFAVVLSGFLALFWYYKEGATFLGDQYYLLRALLVIGSADQLSTVFRHEPLTGFLVWNLSRLFADNGVIAAGNAAYVALSMIGGSIFLVALVLFAKTLPATFQLRFWFGAFIVTTAGTALFFGYVENYALSYAGFVIYLYTGVRAIRGEVSLIVPSAILGILIPLYFGMLVFTPSLLVLFVREIRRKKWTMVLGSLAAQIGITILFLEASSYSAGSLFNRIEGAGTHIVPFGAVQSAWQGYTMFSVRHLLEIVNITMLFSPFALLLFVILTIKTLKSGEWKNAEVLFVLINAVCGLGMLAVFQSDIGMSRDWDLLSVYGLAITVGAGYLLLRSAFDDKEKKFALALIATMTMIHTSSYVLINADPTKAMPRFNVLLENSLWGDKAFTVHEELAMYFRDRGRYSEAIEHYEKFVARDSTNVRVMGSLADVYRTTGELERETDCLERTIKYSPSNKGAYLRLSEIFSKKGRKEEAAEMALRGMALERPTARILSQLGLMSVDLRHDYRAALNYFRRAIAVDSTYADAYLKAGLACQQLGEREEMNRYFTRYLDLHPHSPDAKQLRGFMTVAR